MELINQDTNADQITRRKSLRNATPSKSPEVGLLTKLIARIRQFEYERADDLGLDLKFGIALLQWFAGRLSTRTQPFLETCERGSSGLR